MFPNLFSGFGLDVVFDVVVNVDERWWILLGSLLLPVLPGPGHKIEHAHGSGVAIMLLLVN